MSRKTPWVLPQHDSPNSLILFVSEFFFFHEKEDGDVTPPSDNAFIPYSADIITTLLEEQHAPDRIRSLIQTRGPNQKKWLEKWVVTHVKNLFTNLFLWFMKAFRGIQAWEETWPPEAAPTIFSRLHSALGMGA